MSTHYDYVIVGGGSAGCVLANRLSADPSTSVLVLEAGRPDSLWDVYIHMPAALSFPIGNKHYDWRYESEPEPFMHGRRVYHARGKVLGGSSSINGMIFQRGNPLDYERWGADPGMGEWDYAHCLPYFKKMERCLAGGDEYRGDRRPARAGTGSGRVAAVRALLRGGAAGRLPAHRRRERLPPGGLRPLRPQPPPRPAAERGQGLPPPGHAAAEPEGGLPGPGQPHPVRGHAGRRRGVRRARRTGVGPVERVTAGEVICCGGAINSPQLLQLSGVGNAAELEALGVPVVHDLPGVGENLQDHLEVYIQHACTQPVSMYPALRWGNRPWIGFRWLFLRQGPGATNHFEAGGFIRSNDDVAYPNVMFHFLPIAVRYDGSAPGGGHGYQVHVGPMYSDARGSVKITSTDPAPIRRCASTTCRRHRTGGSGWRSCGRPGRSSPSRRSRPSTAASCRPGRRSRPTGVAQDDGQDRDRAVKHKELRLWRRRRLPQRDRRRDDVREEAHR